MKGGTLVPNAKAAVAICVGPTTSRAIARCTYHPVIRVFWAPVASKTNTNTTLWIHGNTYHLEHATRRDAMRGRVCSRALTQLPKSKHRGGVATCWWARARARPRLPVRHDTIIIRAQRSPRTRSFQSCRPPGAIARCSVRVDG
jgi:hypothetical protein